MSQSGVSLSAVTQSGSFTGTAVQFGYAFTSASMSVSVSGYTTGAAIGSTAIIVALQSSWDGTTWTQAGTVAFGAGQNTVTVSPCSGLYLRAVIAYWGPNVTGGSVTATVGGTVPAVAVINVRNFGATGNGTTDDTAAFNAAISAATGSANPATTARTATAPVYVPAGTYKVTSDIVIRSVVGFKFIGDGPGATILYASGTGFTQAVLFVDGSADGVYEGFAVQGDGTEAAGGSALPDGIRLDFTAAAARSTTGNAFRDIRVRALKFVTGVSLEGNGSVQLDGTCFENVVVSGGQTPGSWSSSGLYQAGFAFGNGTFANNYDHAGSRADASGCYYGYKINASSFALFGAQPAANFCDFWVTPNGQTSLNNIQSQNSGQFLISSGFSPNPVNIDSVYFITTFPQTNNPLITLAGGVWTVRGLSALMISGVSYVAPVITVNGSSATRPCQLVLENIALNGAKTTCIVPTAGQANISVSNYCNYNPATGNYTTAAGDVQSYYTSSAWTTG